MEWLNLHSSTLDSPEVVGAEPVDRATWLFLLRYCIGQENGGHIAACADWGDRKWQQLVRVTLAEVQRTSPLWRFVGDALEVNFYPTARQKEIEAKRQAGKDTVAKRWRKHDCSANSSAINSADTEGEGERKDKGKEKGKHISAVPASACVAEKTALQIRAEQLFKRRPSTAWGKTDAKAWASASKAIEATHEDDWALLEWFYARPSSEKTYRRTDLATLLNNWNAEIDRARDYRAKQATAGKSDDVIAKQLDYTF